MYRFRSVENLLEKFHELENQEIYFAPPEELNDPMEGFLDIYWRGDKIVWEKLLQHYIRCLSQVYTLALLLGDSKKIELQDIPLVNWPTGARMDQDVVNNIQNSFFKEKTIQDLPDALAKRTNPVRRMELLSYLYFIHSFAVNAVSTEFLKKQFISHPLSDTNLQNITNGLKKHGNPIQLINQMEHNNEGIPKMAELLYRIVGSMIDESILKAKFNINSIAASNHFFLLVEFPKHFISRMEMLMYPNWYSASFLKNCDNSAVWGHYGEQHKGVCLIFKDKIVDGNYELNLNKEYGWNNAGAQIGMRPQKFIKVEYDSKHVEIDFFRSLGRAPIHVLNQQWYRDSAGNISICAQHLTGKSDEWREKYWGNFYRGVSIKLKEWDYEEEYRLVLDDNFVTYNEHNKRKLQYDFADLEGIIFGIKTSDEAKMQIIKIIEEKCKRAKRTGFDFYQAYYDINLGKIQKQKMSQLKFNV